MARCDQLKRQWQILQILQAYRLGIGIDVIVEKTECCRRTIERDLNALKSVGFPIYYEKRELGKKFWGIKRQFIKSDKLLVEPTEMMGIYLANQYLAPFKGSAYADGLQQLWNKISKLLPAKALVYFSELNDIVHLKQTAGEPYLPNQHITSIQKAIDENIVLQMSYKPSGKDTVVNMAFHPYGLVLLNNSIYIVGFSEYAKEERTLKLQRIEKIALTEKRFKLPKDFSLSKRFKGSFGIVYGETKPMTVRCKFTGWAAQKIREQKWHSTQVIEKDNGKYLLVSFLLTSTSEFKGWILSFGSQAHVIEPVKLRKQLSNSLAKSLKNYKD